MPRFHRMPGAAMAALALLSGSVQAVVVDSGPVDLPIAATAAGTYLNLVDGNSLASGSDFHPIAAADGSLAFAIGSAASLAVRNGAVATLDQAILVGAANAYAASGTLAATPLRSGGQHRLGLRFVDERSGGLRYGHVLLQTTAPKGFPARILRYAYETSGAAIVTPGDSRIFSDDFQPLLVAASCMPEAVQARLLNAPAGATLQIPAGDCDWGSTQLTHARSIRIRGAGQNLTLLRRSAAMPDYWNALLKLSCGNNSKVEISDLSLLGNGIEGDIDSGLWLDGGCVDFRIHDVTAANFSRAGMAIRGDGQRGVIYRSDFLANFRCAGGCFGYGIDVDGGANPNGGPHPPPLSLGSGNAVFVEDSYFYDNRHGIASNYGSRYVFRHNTVVSTQRTRDYGMIDAHGRENAERYGSQSWEIYANYLRTSPAQMTSDGIVLRGGDGVVFGNIVANIPYVVRLLNQPCSGSYPLPGQVRAAYIWDNPFTPIPIYNNDNAVWIDSSCETYIVQGRDYFLTAPSAYQPYPYPHPAR
ncbi:hypothetical protein DFR29_105110 [Tahibacter aquaticus]|uniref:Parallel beta helix pectate lyase-like protein n=2 Tax=Tahibacter aquaticus TaxID=520092 RepID=A0A4R6Z088_9GAMM|nr:hypothetical protein DFR29_105110 [Tahibacter aquaticus]